MIARIAVIGILVGDQREAFDFWVNRVGFEKRRDDPYGEGPRWLEVAPPGAATRLALEPAPSDDVACADGIPAMTLETDDVRAAHEAMTARGGVFTEQPAEQPWGTQALFLDPNGRVFVLVQR